MGGVLISMIGCGRREGTRRCLQQALQTVPLNTQFVLTDNASKDGTGDMFEEFQRRRPEIITLFREKENTGFIPPGNRSYHLAVTRGCEFTILLNDDTDPPSGWLQNLLAPFADPQVALSCPKGTCCTLDHNFHGSEGQAFEYCEGSCLAIRNSAIQSFSPVLFDENLTGIYGDDSNLSLRAREKGWKIARADFDMPHIRSATTRSPEVSAFCEFHQKKNHLYNVHRWQHYLNTRRFDYPIVLTRSYALGDVLLLTPLIQAIAESNPLSPIYVQTHFPEIFARNPNVHLAARELPQSAFRDAVVINLDDSYESRTMTHIVHGYEHTVRELIPGLGPAQLKTHLYPSPEDVKWASTFISDLSTIKDGKFAIIGSDPTTWVGKNWPRDRYQEVRHQLHKMGWKTIAVGNKTQEITTTIHQLAALMSRANLFIGNDSFPLHVAQAMGCPSVGIFGTTLPRFILTQGSKAVGVAADPSIPCAGERHRETGRRHFECSGACIQSITPDQVWSAIQRLEVL